MLKRVGLALALAAGGASIYVGIVALVSPENTVTSIIGCLIGLLLLCVIFLYGIE